MANRSLFFLLIFLLTWISTLSFSFRNEEKIKANVVYLGSVDGKSFFAQMTPLVTWLEAKGNCTESGMQLASITSIEQRTLLNQAYDNVTFTGRMWTSGRDARNYTQLVWDSSGEPLNGTVATSYDANSGMLTCLTFYVPTKSNTSFHFDAQLCTEKHGAICEINHGL